MTTPKKKPTILENRVPLLALMKSIRELRERLGDAVFIPILITQLSQPTRGHKHGAQVKIRITSRKRPLQGLSLIRKALAG